MRYDDSKDMEKRKLWRREELESGARKSVEGGIETQKLTTVITTDISD